MENLKQYLIEDTNKKIKETEEEIKKSDKELRILEAEFKVEKRFSEMKGLDKEIEEDIKYSVPAVENLLVMEKNRNSELKKDLKVMQTRTKVIDKFGEDEL